MPISVNKKVIFVVSALHGGGAERVVSTLANHLANKEAYDVTILMVAGDEVVYDIDKKIHLISLCPASGKNPLTQISRIFKMRNFFKEHSDAYINAFSTNINIFTILSCLGLGFKDRLVVSERNDPNRCSFIPLRNFIYNLDRHCQFVFQTEDARYCFNSSIQTRGTVISNPLREDVPLPATQPRKKVITAAGRLEPQKNHKLLLEAFSKIEKTFPDYTLTIFGKGKLLEELKNQAQQLGIVSKVSFPGFVADANQHINESSCYVMSSDYEGMPNSLMEAMAMAVPVVATDCPIGGSRMLLEHGGGQLVPMNDAASLSAAIKEVLTNTENNNSYYDVSKYIRDNFNVEHILSQWENLWK